LIAVMSMVFHTLTHIKEKSQWCKSSILLEEVRPEIKI
jgi:hypothetical protein